MYWRGAQSRPIERRPPLETEIGGLGSGGSAVSWSRVKKK